MAIWRNPLTFICRQKIKFILYVFLEILQRYCKLIVLGTLGMPGYKKPQWYYQLVANVRVYLLSKNQLLPPCFSGNIAKICKLLILRTLGMPGCTHPKVYDQLVEDFHAYLHAKNKFYNSLLSWDITFKRILTWLADSFLAHNSRTRILPDVGLMVKYQEQYQFQFCIISKKN